MCSNSVIGHNSNGPTEGKSHRVLSHMASSSSSSSLSPSIPYPSFVMAEISFLRSCRLREKATSGSGVVEATTTRPLFPLLSRLDELEYLVRIDSNADIYGNNAKAHEARRKLMRISTSIDVWWVNQRCHGLFKNTPHLNTSAVTSLQYS